MAQGFRRGPNGKIITEQQGQVLDKVTKAIANAVSTTNTTNTNNTNNSTNNTNTNSAPSNNTATKKHYDYAQQQVDEQAILDKFNAATTAQFNLQREQNRQAENQFYNQMYNTQQTAMDTIRQSNAAAVSTGASRGIQAANELSALLGLQQESVASATELANINRQTAQEETAAVLENVLNAYKQAQQERQNLITAGIQADSVNNEQITNLWSIYLQASADGNSTAAANALAELEKLGAKTEHTSILEKLILNSLK